mmetsp:Transcript_28253/g.37714  ORF Transcript_28253/g.37714 Transcript_28253/m.37714 type:complete len:212 (-) Transcript_28253:70-705(-)|eukprot:CAMPEP_0185590856 /NCGR_PEP_ID=MMETSP0434-20130131/62304_1 /TAXON_ID=626734 ORGANISM="Favella taraikaensis, Strain Fe Narragansett Bay" /NCGR_SAMPLE_ID=MMETSP0434 /ASSEMBLY_ACC=CAM_ASM_000379 /LENGTH=211 /DNA_ID=CAMNT_0028215367 /DNA_START=542 /DNA_END=1177 /DNA_ORIENTATION=+
MAQIRQRLLVFHHEEVSSRLHLALLGHRLRLLRFYLVALSVDRHHSQATLRRCNAHLMAESQHLELLLLEHDLAVHLQVDFVGEHVEASVHEDLSARLPRVYQVVDVVALHPVQLVHHVEKADEVDRHVRHLALLLPQVVRGEAEQLGAEGVAEAEEGHARHHHVNHLLRHHEVVHLEREVQNVVVVRAWVVDLRAEVRLVVVVDRVNLTH